MRIDLHWLTGAVNKLLHSGGVVKGIEVDVADQKRGEGAILRLRSVCRAVPCSSREEEDRLRFATAGQWGTDENQEPKPKGDLQPRESCELISTVLLYLSRAQKPTNR